VVSDARVWSQAEQERVRRLAVAAVVEQGMSVAAAGRVFGVSRQTVNAIETERYDPSLPLAFKLARLFKLPIEDIFDG